MHLDLVSPWCYHSICLDFVMSLLLHNFAYILAYFNINYLMFQGVWGHCPTATERGLFPYEYSSPEAWYTGPASSHGCSTSSTSRLSSPSYQLCPASNVLKPATCVIRSASYVHGSTLHNWKLRPSTISATSHGTACIVWRRSFKRTPDQ